MKKIVLLVLIVAVALSGCVSITQPPADGEQKTVVDIPVENRENVTDTPEEQYEIPAKAESEMLSRVSGKIIVIDAGHGISAVSRQEQIAPGSSETKSAFATGTAGANQTEEQLNLAVALKLQEALLGLGAEVHMTRTDHTTARSNIDRAVFANDLGAHISVKLHADGSTNSEVHGVSVLVPGSQYIGDSELIANSRKAGELILNGIVTETGAANRGISVRNDMTGFNWSEVPVVLVEMGFMTNPAEDSLMETDEYQYKIVNGIIHGLEMYFE